MKRIISKFPLIFNVTLIMIGMLIVILIKSGNKIEPCLLKLYSIIAVLSFIIYCILEFLRPIKEQFIKIKAIKNYSSDVFGIIDIFKTGDEEDLERRIVLINTIYREGGIVDDLINNGKDKELLKRKKLLEYYSSFQIKDYASLIIAPVIGLILSTLFSSINDSDGDLIYTFISPFVVGILTSFCLLLYLAFVLGESIDAIDPLRDYEIELLNSKLHKVKAASDKEINLLILNRLVLNSLYLEKSESKDRERKEEINSMIDEFKTKTSSRKELRKYYELLENRREELDEQCDKYGLKRIGGSSSKNKKSVEKKNGRDNDVNV